MKLSIHDIRHAQLDRLMAQIETRLRDDLGSHLSFGPEPRPTMYDIWITQIALLRLHEHIKQQQPKERE